jgi:hypothetical protein
MRGHLPACDHDVMNPAPARYVIRINGHRTANHQDQVTAAHRDGHYRRAHQSLLAEQPKENAVLSISTSISIVGPKHDDDRRTCRGKGVSSVSEDSGRAVWLQAELTAIPGIGPWIVQGAPPAPAHPRGIGPH